MMDHKKNNTTVHQNSLQQRIFNEPPIKWKFSVDI